LQIDSVEESLGLLRSALAGEHKAGGEIVALNAGAAIYAAGLAESIAQGVKLAQEIIPSGRAVAKLEELASFTQAMAG
jgi:anthranilate phosphoribosyltransferase